MEHKFFIADGALCVQIRTTAEDSVHAVLSDPHFQIWFREQVAIDHRIDTVQFGSSGDGSLDSCLQFSPGVGIGEYGPDVSFIDEITSEAISLIKTYNPVSFIAEFTNRAAPSLSLPEALSRVSDPQVKYVLEIIVEQVREIREAIEAAIGM